MPSRRGHGEGSIYQRESDGRWCATVDLGWVNGKRKRKVIYGATRKEVADKLKALHRDVALGVNVAPDQLTVKDFLNTWLEEHVRRFNRPRTYEKYKADVTKHIVPAIGNRQLAKLTPQQVQAMLNGLRDKKLAQRSVSNVRAVLRRALNHAMRWGYVMRNVATLVEAPRTSTFTIEPLTQEQANKLLEAAKGHRLEAVYRVALSIGLRRGEICGLRWEDIDFEERVLRVTGSLQRQNKRLERSATKTAASVRTIALPPGLLRALKSHKARQDKEREELGDDWRECGLVFVSERGTPLEPGNVLRHFRTLLKAAKLPEKTRFHDLRHTCATLLVAQGRHPRVVMEILGHAQISTTMNTYAHVLPDTQRQAVEGIDGLFAGVEEEDEQ
jgi:integrase